MHGWSRFKQLQIDGVAHGTREVNIYFLTVRVVRPSAAQQAQGLTKSRSFLLGLFPGALGGVFGAGVFSMMSVDGVRWSLS